MRYLLQQNKNLVVFLTGRVGLEGHVKNVLRKAREAAWMCRSNASVKLIETM
jgi:hypothetical protein